ncbi:unnamed protein product [Brassicogethes aeneus]|uniref:Enoyl reductase (ER) domain-containing protein n=1 Tax=Brassicogethes aeneus TaxID=1431903 RepID=A0A9P0BIV1_BRAAE|nr:unnamed protein product [Brassicogethes aeneus]
MVLETSKSVVVTKFGGYESIQIKEFDLPSLEGTIEVKVSYGGLNFADLYTRQGLMMDKKLPFVLGMECSGIITAIGAENTDFKVGQQVVCYDHQGGMFREKIRVPPRHVFAVPDDLDGDVAASLFVNYLTAYFAVLQTGNLRENEQVLIMSCAGGLGWAATQLSKTVKGVKIIGTGSDFKAKFAMENGVDIFIDKNNVGEYKYDLILCTESGPILETLQNLLNPLGRIVMLGANNIIQNENKLSTLSLLKLWWTTKTISPESLIMNNRTCSGLHLGTLMELEPQKVDLALKKILGMLNDGKINPRIHCTYPLEEIVSATKDLANRKNIGKVLLKF